MANFHLRNGAEFHSVRWMGNPRLQGLRSSAGVMVNYLYPLQSLEENARRYTSGSGSSSGSGVNSKDEFSIPLGEDVRNILK